MASREAPFFASVIAQVGELHLFVVASAAGLLCWIPDSRPS